uniref:S-adenosylmethionine:tRNA ribosyltransferase-isomerase n=1 Tax=Candidatus Kentrum sp. TC TaxID=2126339 RepID=A0A450YJJ3_9GAMM|nr:MAG: S-adenosylmethionine:tRNA ribosyltransferase-isomerase [Candidatus Kentron sp. TC]VFK41698.1 MAG: S-adenosylmethionine:tRNA ribosyltransferase-isomerase [Candidatus Kentron sp. TC]VFK53780.1 MAG: S-adenosylmethionine:tRNA ribosyltransferase-isomerase [Candidatus Kentron sp. TC]
MQASDFYYHLPDELIAQYPAGKRTASRLLVLDGKTGALHETKFSELTQFLSPGDLVVFNDTRVIPARLSGRKSTGGKVEIMVERVMDERHILAQVRASKPPRFGTSIRITRPNAPNAAPEDAESIRLTVRKRQENFFILQTDAYPVRNLLQDWGMVPLPPYIRRPGETLDKERYQTVYAKQEGAVAAPTAGLHFDELMLTQFRSRGIKSAFITLHIGSGTFSPLRVDRVEDHKMHTEYLDVPPKSCAIINQTRQAGGRIIAVGTTSVRALESAWWDGQIHPFRGYTNLFIYPGYRFRCVDAMISNFHLPGSTLLMLVSAFANREQVLRAYQYAVEKRFRFYSYGDAMLLM